MKRLTIEKIYIGILLVIFGGIVVHAPLSVIVATLAPQLTLVFKAWKELLMVIAAVLLVVLIYRSGQIRIFLRDRILQLIAAYVAFHVILLVALWQGFAPGMAGLMIDLRYVLYFVLVYIGLRLYPQYHRLFLKVGIAGALLVLGFALLQVFILPPDVLKYLGYSQATIVPYLTVDLNSAYIRINSTLRGPNPLGAYAGICLTLLVAACVKGKIARRRLPLTVAGILLFGAIVAVWASYSRSALLAAVVAVAIVLVTTVARKMSRRSWIMSSVVICALIGGILAVGGDRFISNVFLHNNPDGGSLTKSNDGHLQSVETGVSRLLRQPFGGGVGSTGSASLYGHHPLIIENHYLFVAHEAGWLGLLLFIAVFILILVRLWQKRSDWLALGMFASGVGLGVIGLLLPVWADDTVSIIWWGLVAVALARRG